MSERSYDERPSAPPQAPPSGVRKRREYVKLCEASKRTVSPIECRRACTSRGRAPWVGSSALGPGARRPRGRTDPRPMEAMHSTRALVVDVARENTPDSAVQSDPANTSGEFRSERSCGTSAMIKV